MATGALCDKCGNDNPLGRMFCVQCGAKLKLDKPPMPSPVEQAKLTGMGFIFKLIRLVILAILLGLLGMLAWPLPLEGQMGDSQDAMTFYRDLVRVDHAVKKRESVDAVIQEGELNAYLDEVVRKQSAETTSPLQVKVSNARIQIQPDHVVVLLRAHLGPLPLSYEITGTPVFLAGRFKLNVTAARFGHLPMPALARPWLAGRIGTFFQRLERERNVLNNLDRWEAEPGSATVYSDPHA